LHKHLLPEQVLFVLKEIRSVKGLKDILLLGDPRLYEVCEPLIPEDGPLIAQMVRDMHNTILEFRARYQAGRAIAAPQLGYMKRLIYMFVNGESTVFINPEIVYQSEEMMELWDDCMSLPNLLVRLKRHQTIHIRFFDLNWTEHQLVLENDLSELLQHEYDHLNGILCTMRALDTQAFRWKPTPVLTDILK
jgi:peptide deformylase